jgi:hypothetical protein
VPVLIDVGVLCTRYQLLAALYAPLRLVLFARGYPAIEFAK